MGFLDVLRNWTAPLEGRAADPRRLFDTSGGGGGTSHPEFPGAAPVADPEEMALPPATSPYDREQWRRKLKRILEHLPQSEPQWNDLQQEAGALDLGQDWVAAAYREELALMIRKIVSDRVVTSAEHRNLDLARLLMGIPDKEAEDLFHAIVTEAEGFFGGAVEGA